jgi:flagellar biosynthesis protein FlhB
MVEQVGRVQQLFLPSPSPDKRKQDKSEGQLIASNQTRLDSLLIVSLLIVTVPFWRSLSLSLSLSFLQSPLTFECARTSLYNSNRVVVFVFTFAEHAPVVAAASLLLTVSPRPSLVSFQLVLFGHS